MNKHLKERDGKIILKIVGIYVASSALWIYSSDHVLGWLVREPELMVQIAVYKGIMFILLTALLLCFLLARYTRHKRRTEIALLESEAKYQELFEVSNEAIILIDQNTGRILEANRATSYMYGYTREEILAMRYLDFSAEPERTLLMSQQSAVGSSQIFPNFFHKRKNQEQFPVEILSRCFLWRNRPVLLVAIRDITERKHLVEELAEKVQRLEEALDKVKKLEGVIKICMDCKKIRVGDTNWHPLEKFLAENSDTVLSHGLCPDCYNSRMQDIAEFSNQTKQPNS